MLEQLHLKNVGPAAEMVMDLAPRLNLITGDNGLGKTLLLDSAWWALTRTWPLTWGGKGVVPDKESAAIEWVGRRGATSLSGKSEYDFASSHWKRDEGHPPTTRVAEMEESRQQGALVLYLRVDGGISVHDPLRVGEGFRHPFGKESWGSSNVFQFGEAEIWNGLELGGDKASNICEGLVRDVSRWAVQDGNADFDLLARVVAQLAGEEPFRLTRRVGRVYVDDARDYPFLTGPAGELPVAHAPAGLRRILSLAYLLVWAWREHKVAAGLKKRPPNASFVMLIDEVEGHLHPKWQRTILPSLLGALGKDTQLQVIATTHSPMVLASTEPFFDAEQDAWFDLDLEQGKVQLRRRPYVRHGEIGNWLVSEAFDLKEPRSLEGEQAIAVAQALLDADAPSVDEIAAADQGLRNAGLPDIDPFWVRWGYFVEKQKATPKKPAAPPTAKRGRKA